MIVGFILYTLYLNMSDRHKKNVSPVSAGKFSAPFLKKKYWEKVTFYKKQVGQMFLKVELDFDSTRVSSTI